MINLTLLQEYINQNPDKITIFTKSPNRTRINYNSYTIEEIIDGRGIDIICQVLVTDGIRDYERLSEVDKSEFLSWIRDNKINDILNEDLG